MLFGPAKSIWLLNNILVSPRLEIEIFPALERQDKK